MQSTINQGQANARIDVADSSEALAGYINDLLGSNNVTIEYLDRLSGGAIQENWLVAFTVNGGNAEGQHRWVLRTDSASAVAVSMSRVQEFAVLRAVHMAGVKVPKPLWLCRDRKIIGRDFFFMQALQGIASGYRLTADAGLVVHRGALSQELGTNLALLHQITPPHSSLSFLPLPSSNPARASINQYRGFLDELGASFPVLEWGLRWCELNMPEPLAPCLIHRDYRTGNYMVDEGRLTGILDWEFTAWGDSREDIGWFTAKCWRFSRPDRLAGGVGELEDFLRGYEAVSGSRLNPQELVFWQVMAHLRWAIVAVQQTQRHLSGQQRSLELALTGRMVPELELEILALTGGKS